MVDLVDLVSLIPQSLVYLIYTKMMLVDELKWVWIHLGMLVQRNWSGEQVDGQTSSEPSPQSSSLSHTHWEGMQRPPAQVNSVSRQGGEGGGQATPSHCHTPSSQELDTQRKGNPSDFHFDNNVKKVEYNSLFRLTDQFWQCWVMVAPGGKMEPSHSHGHWGGTTQLSPVEQKTRTIPIFLEFCQL